jgi:hypothetical protein
MARERINDFKDVECTCSCGNKHELYNGKGYRTVSSEGFSDGQVDGGYYRAEYSCNNCNKTMVVQF